MSMIVILTGYDCDHDGKVDFVRAILRQGLNYGNVWFILSQEFNLSYRLA
jgi:hypothetical protein